MLGVGIFIVFIVIVLVVKISSNNKQHFYSTNFNDNFSAKVDSMYFENDALNNESDCYDFVDTDCSSADSSSSDCNCSDCGGSND